jgi:DNA-binding response OmpR family regulator
MPDDLPPLQVMQRKPTQDRPLLGLTVLVVEDSRFACEAIRLLCLRSGARIRRADCLSSARRHLAVYRPNAIIIDLGLPDGSGLDLISELATTDPRVPVILGTSGDLDGQIAAIDAGADGYLQKPITALAAFQEALLAHLPSDIHPSGPRILSTAVIDPDPIALRDDLVHVAEVLAVSPSDQPTLTYIAQFLDSVGRSSTDTPLVQAAGKLAEVNSSGAAPGNAIAAITALVDTRLTASGAF